MQSLELFPIDSILGVARIARCIESVFAIPGAFDPDQDPMEMPERGVRNLLHWRELAKVMRGRNPDSTTLKEAERLVFDLTENNRKKVEITSHATNHVMIEVTGVCQFQITNDSEADTFSILIGFNASSEDSQHYLPIAILRLA